MNWLALNEEQRFYTLQTMLYHGGGFASALATAWMRADSVNGEALGRTFPELVRKYGPTSELYVRKPETIQPLRFAAL